MDALQAVTQLKIVASIFQFLRLAMPRDELQLVGHVLSSDSRGIGLSLSLATVRGNVIDTVTLWDKDCAPPTTDAPAAPGKKEQALPTVDGSAARSEKEQTLDLAVMGATWTVFQILKKKGLRESELRKTMGTPSWRSYGLARLGTDTGTAEPNARRALLAGARDADPENLTAHFNLGTIERRKPDTLPANWHLEYVRAAIRRDDQQQLGPDLDSFYPLGRLSPDNPRYRDPLRYQLAYNWNALRLHNQLLSDLPDGGKKPWPCLDQEDVEHYTFVVRELVEVLQRLENPASPEEEELSGLLSELEKPSLVLLAELLVDVPKCPRPILPMRAIDQGGGDSRNEAGTQPTREDLQMCFRVFDTLKSDPRLSHVALARQILEYVLGGAWSTRALYNLACYCGQSDDKDAPRKALFLLRESFEKAAKEMVAWAERDPSLYKLRLADPEGFWAALIDAGATPSELAQLDCLRDQGGARLRSHEIGDADALAATSDKDINDLATKATLELEHLKRAKGLSVMRVELGLNWDDLNLLDKAGVASLNALARIRAPDLHLKLLDYVGLYKNGIPTQDRISNWISAAKTKAKPEGG